MRRRLLPSCEFLMRTIFVEYLEFVGFGGIQIAQGENRFLLKLHETPLWLQDSHEGHKLMRKWGSDLHHSLECRDDSSRVQGNCLYFFYFFLFSIKAYKFKPILRSLTFYAKQKFAARIPLSITNDMLCLVALVARVELPEMIIRFA